MISSFVLLGLMMNSSSLIAGADVSTSFGIHANPSDDSGQTTYGGRSRVHQNQFRVDLTKEATGYAPDSRVGAAVSDVVYEKRDRLCESLWPGDLFDCVVEALVEFESQGCEGTDDFSLNPRFVDGVDSGEVVSTAFIAGDCVSELDGRGGAPFTVTLTDFAALDLKGSGITVQPDLPGGATQGFVNLPVNVFSSDAAQVLEATVLGEPVQIRAVPTSFAVAWGDGEVTGPLKDPGTEVFDHGTLKHEYRRVADYAITLTTTWQGSWSFDGQTWTRIPGEVTTTDVTGQFSIKESLPVLVTIE